MSQTSKELAQQMLGQREARHECCVVTRCLCLENDDGEVVAVLHVDENGDPCVCFKEEYHHSIRLMDLLYGAPYMRRRPLVEDQGPPECSG